MDNITPPYKLRYTPRGKGGYTGGGIGGTPHIRGYLYISIWYPPPMLPQLSICLSMYLSLIQIYELYFTMSNYKGIKKRDKVRTYKIKP